MKVVVGLGNPGLRYRSTRHNVGFEVLACLARRYESAAPRVKFEAEVVETRIAEEKTLLVAPQTYMNASGRSVRRLIDFYQLPLEDLLVVCDDMNLDVGRLRWRRSGSSGGQKGLEDIINRLGTQDFARLRIGIGRAPDRIDPADYVLSRFRSEDVEPIEQAIQLAGDGVEMWLGQGLDATMNRFNAPLTD
jgi:PTH1 family peptidyl-tRNA hydrolase